MGRKKLDPKERLVQIYPAIKAKYIEALGGKESCVKMSESFLNSMGKEKLGEQ